MPSDSDQRVTIKTENGTSYKRLPSFRTPRDLKLSEFRDIRPNPLNENRPKRVFVPNLNVQRKKQIESVDASVANNNTAKSVQKERDRKDDRGRGRGRGRRQNNFIQSAGVFSEGLAPTLKHWNSSRRSSDATTSISRPKLNLKDNFKVNKEEEEKVIKSLLRDDFIDDPDSLEQQDCPLELPLLKCKGYITKCESEECYPKEEIFHKNFNGIKVKVEPGTCEDATDVSSFMKADIKPVNVRHKRLISVHQLLSRTSDRNFIFFQIPICLPSMKVNMGTTKNNPKKDQKIEEDTRKCVLRTLSPGLIGKLQTLKSGRARLVLGDVKLWVEPGTQTVFRQDLTSVNLDTADKTGRMINLGDVTTRMLVTPDWGSLILYQLHR